MAVPAAVKVGVWPGTGLFEASLSVMVTVEVVTPSAVMLLVPAMFEFAATGAPAVNVTVPSDLLTGDVMVSVFTSAVSDDNVQLETPAVFVVLQPPFALSEPVSVARKRGSTPATGLLNASNNVMVMNDVATPSAVTGPVPVMVEVAAATGPAMKSTLPSVLETGVTMARVFVSALVEASVQVETPFTSVTEHAESVLLVPVALNVGVKPGAGFPPASFSVTLIVLVDTPSATIELVPLISEVAATGGPGSNTTVPPIFTTGVAIERVLVSALVEVSKQVEVPVTSLTLQAAGVLPVPLAVKVGVMPATGLLKASPNRMVTVDVSLLLAITGPVPLMVEFAATGTPAIKTTLPPALITGVVMARFFVSAFVEARVQTAFPATLVTPQAPKVLSVPSAEKLGVSPAIGLLKISAR